MNQGICKFKITSLTAIILLSGCAHAPVTNIEPIPLGTIEAGKNKIPGKYALVIDAKKMHGTYYSTSTTCSFYEYPYDVRKSYANLLLQALNSSIESVELIESNQKPKTESYSAVISIETASMETKFNIKRGIFTDDAIAFSSITSNVNIAVGNKIHRLEKFNSTRNYTAPLGYACAKVPEAMEVSIEHSSHESVLAILKFATATLLSDTPGK